MLKSGHFGVCYAVNISAAVVVSLRYRLAFACFDCVAKEKCHAVDRSVW